MGEERPGEERRSEERPGEERPNETGDELRARLEPLLAKEGYRLERLLGRGGMGVVYLADDTVLERQVAIKLISGDVDLVTRQRFLVEARAVARLQHPNVVSIYRVGEVGGAPFLVSEFVRGRPLDDLDLPLQPDLALEIARGMARALAAAHARGVVHRDIKPANAILAEDGTVKLLDFGIAKLDGIGPAPAHVSPEPIATPGAGEAQADASTCTVDLPAAAPSAGEAQADASTCTVDLPAAAPSAGEAQADASTCTVDVAPPPELGGERSLTAAGAVLGTPRFLAPEVWLGAPATFRSDIYSFGVLMFTMVAGRPPHPERKLDELSRAAISRDAPPVDSAAPRVDPRLAAVIDRCLARDAGRRFASGNALRAELDAIGHEHDVALPAGNPYRGLDAFEASHRDVFFGRDSEIRLVLEGLARREAVIVAGDSGVGKSSLCRAGVLPRFAKQLAEEDKDSGRSWRSVIVSPGPHPVEAFATALAGVLERPETEIAAELRADPASLARAVRAQQGDQRGLLLFVDQLEELVTVAQPQEAQSVAELLGWLAVPAPAARLLASARGDYLSRLASLPFLGEVLPRALFFLRPLSRERVREAVIRPAEAKGVRFDPPELVDELAAAASDSAAGLPLLQFTLAELWDARDRDSGAIRRADLDAVGGVAGALARHADDVLAALLPEQHAIARALLLRLVSDQGTRARRHADELDAHTGVRAEVLGALVRGRLVAARQSKGAASYEIAHESLIAGWPTLASWLARDADTQRTRDLLRRAVGEWKRLGHRRETLWRGAQLREGRRLAELTADERAFMSASVRADMRRRVGRVALLAALPALVLAVIVFARVWISRTKDAAVGRRIARAERALGRARKARREAMRWRGRALRAFDAGELERAERIWRRYRRVARDVHGRYATLARDLETTLLLDRSHVDARARFADVLYERAELAEAQGDRAALTELLGRLALYDADGSRRRRWRAPSPVLLDVRPAGAHVALHRYAEDERGRLRARPLTGTEVRREGARYLLAPGSYLLVARSPGHVETRLPFVVRRGTRSRLAIRLPPRRAIPQGFVYVPPGEVRFGSGAPDGQRRDFFHTVPIHRRRTGAFLIARYETTWADWLRYLEALPAETRANALPRVGKGGFQGALSLRKLDDGGWQLSIRPASVRYRVRAGERIRYPGRERRREQDWRRMPVSGIAVADAEAYLRWLATSGGVPGARLCSELEWERATRGADGRAYPHGTRLHRDDANFDQTYGKDPRAMGPDEVGSHPSSASPFGVHDLTGNVWEWTRSSVQRGKYAARGGSYYFGAISAHATDREITEPKFRDVSVGLRVCADAPKLHAESARGRPNRHAKTARASGI